MLPCRPVHCFSKGVIFLNEAKIEGLCVVATVYFTTSFTHDHYVCNLNCSIIFGCVFFYISLNKKWGGGGIRVGINSFGFLYKHHITLSQWTVQNASSHSPKIIIIKMILTVFNTKKDKNAILAIKYYNFPCPFIFKLPPPNLTQWNLEVLSPFLLFTIDFFQKLNENHNKMLKTFFLVLKMFYSNLPNLTSFTH